jgi:hypothetical protein
MKLRISERKQAKIKMALQGSAGSGKTMSALLLAKGLTNDNLSKVAIIDTENGSSNLYSHLGSFNVLTLSPPYTPEKYIEAIDMCLNANMEVIILDSISHCWDELLDYHSRLPGNSFTNWNKVTPRQKAFVDKILQSSAHFISTMRTKQDYVLNQRDGKYVPEKVGLKAVQRDGVEYEFTLVFDIDSKHFAVASKDRTNLFSGKADFVINTSTGKKILDWCNNGKDLTKIKQEINNCETLDGLRHLYSKYPDLKADIYNDIIKRKAQIEQIESVIVPNEQIINQNQIKNADRNTTSE